MIDFTQLTKEQRDGVLSLVGAMQKTAIKDLQNLKHIGAHILTFGKDPAGSHRMVLDFDALDTEALSIIAHTIEMLQKSLLQQLNDEKGDPDEKGIVMSTPKGEVNLSTNGVKDEVKNLTPLGLHFLELHLHTINSPFSSDAEGLSKSSLFANVSSLFSRIGR